MTGDSTRVSVTVGVAPPLAFEIFTAEIDRWWRRGGRFRHSGRRSGLLRMEPLVGGRLFESIDGEKRPYVFEVGRVQDWDPPRLLTFSWRNGLQGADFSRMIGLWWGEQMSSLREVCAAGHS